MTHVDSNPATYNTKSSDDKEYDLNTKMNKQNNDAKPEWDTYLPSWPTFEASCHHIAQRQSLRSHAATDPN